MDAKELFKELDKSSLKVVMSLYQVVMMNSEPEQIAMEESFFGL